ncbi:hypothetical protein C8R31_10576 [Nitrosospira sp. Nsp2]|uniref:hypothetical protein n=1 Tax=Nitrosospira sp. Nsp2 TaxID=136548 RepID=UPI000D44C50A|nr:hypothetical protein [Nitrosospira sp. Nsp2]PTR14719.1 hypothetical protein C8R31_10576 [Nitrosospira sp. Nsp2]
MSNTALDLLEHAKSINEDEGNQEEIRQRAVVNRGYYAIYHLAKEIAEKFPLPEPRNNGGGSHQKLFNRLIDASVGPPTDPLVLRSIGYMAARTKQFRVWADYKLNEPQPSNAAAQTLANAAKVLENSANLSSA